MVKINGKEYGFFMNAWAMCEINDWIIAHGQGRSAESAMVQKAAIMNKAYTDVHGGEKLTTKEVLALPAWEFGILCDEISKQEAIDCRRTVEDEPVEEDEGKNAGSPD